MKKPRLSRFWITIAILAVCLVLPISPKAQDSTFITQHYAVSGIHVNQGITYGLFGILNQISNKFAIFTQADLGGFSQAYSTVSIYYIPIGTNLTLGAILGPQVELINENPDYEETITYLTGTSGLIIVQNISKTTGIWAGFRYLFSDSNIKPLKIGAGLIVKL